MTLHHKVLISSLCLMLLTGCQSNDDKTQNYGEANQSQKQEHNHDHADHDHGHGKGPNGGHLLELGEEEYHAEFVFDPKTKKTTLYISGKDYHKPQPINAEEVFLELKVGEEIAEVPFTAAPLEGEKDGTSSRFELPGDQLPDGIAGEDEFNGTVHITIGEKEYSAEITHETKAETDNSEKEATETDKQKPKQDKSE